MEFYSCPLISNMYLNINGRIDTGENPITLCCEGAIKEKPAVSFKETAEETLRSFIGMRSMTVAESIKYGKSKAEHGKYTSGCAKCANYQIGEQELSMLISYVNLSMYPAPCQCRCCYCEVAKHWSNAPEVADAYEKIFDMLELGKETGIISPGALWQISTGEITIHPYRKRIMQLVKGLRSNFYTNAFLYDEDIAQNLHDNPGSVINLSIDAGTPETWKKIKGFDNFEEVTSNLVQYYKQSTRAGQITLKYIVLPDINDNYEDYVSLMGIMKVLEVKHLTISRDTRKKYSLSRGEQTKLTGAAAYLLAMCHKNGITNDMFTYTQEEREEAVRLANEILKTSQI